MTKLKIITVTELTNYVKNTLESMVGRVCVSGEISGFKAAYSGHAYFTLKDSGAALNCVMFRSSLARASFALKDGLQVEATGLVTVYPPRGQYQLIVESVREAGIGDLFRKFDELKEKLKKEGLFAPEHKKPLPFLPLRIGVITSATGAAVRDIINVLSRRFPHLHIYIYHTLVQGKEASLQIAHAIKRMNELDLAEVLIVGRGGGSLEDLWAFNEETTARAIFHSRIPVISAVGHETDFTIADFTADSRAPTPSAAAELVTMNHQRIMENLVTLNGRMNQSIARILENRRLTLEKLSQSHILHSPLVLLRQMQQRLDDLAEKMSGLFTQTVRDRKRKLELVNARLTALSPESVMKRGYSIVSNSETGEIVRDSGKVSRGDMLDITLWKGSLKARSEEIITTEDKNNNINNNWENK